MYADTRDYITDCATCSTAGPPPVFRALSPGNLIPEGPLDVLCMDAATDMPLTFRGNTQLIVFADVFTGYIMTKATPNRNPKRSLSPSRKLFFAALEPAANYATIETRPLCRRSSNTSAICWAND